jgi:hypothetical protein
MAKGEALDIVIEVYRDVDHARGPEDQFEDGKSWNIVLYEVDGEGEPDLSGWESQPFGEKRFSYSDARRIQTRLVLGYRGKHRVRSKITSAPIESNDAPRYPSIYRVDRKACGSQDFNDS